MQFSVVLIEASNIGLQAHCIFQHVASFSQDLTPMNIATSIGRSALHVPDRPAVAINGKTTNYRRLNENAGNVASALAGLGICPGDRVALCAPNSLE